LLALAWLWGAGLALLILLIIRRVGVVVRLKGKTKIENKHFLWKEKHYLHGTVFDSASNQPKNQTVLLASKIGSI
jgi:hypothetical protein